MRRKTRQVKDGFRLFVPDFQYQPAKLPASDMLHLFEGGPHCVAMRLPDQDDNMFIRRLLS